MTETPDHAERSPGVRDTEPGGDDTIHDEHTSEPAEGSRQPPTDAQTDTREHPSEPAEGRTDIER
ncbi:MAG: hypothetical protein QOF01_136 [Thermomicrobiales bacterium]|jgi:hypothetical protein|nr:hypothetical protein [Thermomicrobiales bacterium]